MREGGVGRESARQARLSRKESIIPCLKGSDKLGEFSTEKDREWILTMVQLVWCRGSASARKRGTVPTPCSRPMCGGQVCVCERERERGGGREGEKET